MTIELIGAAGWTLENKTFYEKELLVREVPNFVYVGHGIKKPLPRNGSNNLEWRRLERPSAATTALTEGTPPAVTQTTWSNVAATVSQYGAWNQVSDVAIQQSIDDVIPELTMMWGEHMRDSLDRIARDILVAGTNVSYADSATSRGALTVGNILDEVELRTLRRLLKRRNATPMRSGPYRGKFVYIDHPDAFYDLLSDTTIQNVLQNAGSRGGANPYFTGDQFDYLGIAMLETTNTPAVSGGGLSLAAAVHIFQGIMFGDQAYGESEFGFDTMEIIVKPVGSGGTSDPLNQHGTTGWKAAYTAAITNQNFIQRLEHANSANATP